MSRDTAPKKAKAPLHPQVKAATPSWMGRVSVGLAWGGAAATSVLFIRTGIILDRGVAAVDVTLLVVCAVVAAACSAGSSWFAQWAEATAERTLRQRLVAAAFGSGVAGTAGRSGRLLSSATGGVERTAHYRAGFLGPITGALTTPFLVLAVMAVGVSPAVAGRLALLVLLVPLLIGAFQRFVRPLGAEYGRSLGALTASFLEAIQALETLVLARAAGRVAGDLAERGEQHRARIMKLLAGNQLIILIVDGAFSLTVIVAAAGMSIARIQDDAMTFGQGVAIVLMSLLVTGPVDMVGQFFYIGIGGRAAQSQLSAQLAAHEAAAPAAGTVRAADALPGSLVLDGLTCGWPGGPDVLTDLSFTVAPGKRVALVGPSGVGKSTAGAAIQAHLRPTSGRVIVDGYDTATTDGATVRASLAVVEQRTFLFLGSIADNLRLAKPGATDDELWRVLELAGLRDEVAAMERGLDTPVGEHGMLLSGGQAQRLSIARAWLRDAPILLLDEPTSQVDLAGEAAILEALDRLAEGRTVLMIAHRPGAILAADRTVSLRPAVSSQKGMQ